MTVKGMMVATLPVWAVARALPQVFLACEPPPASCCAWIPVHAAGRTDALKTNQQWGFPVAFHTDYSEMERSCEHLCRINTDRQRMSDKGHNNKDLTLSHKVVVEVEGWGGWTNTYSHTHGRADRQRQKQKGSKKLTSFLFDLWLW